MLNYYENDFDFSQNTTSIFFVSLSLRGSILCIMQANL